MADQDQSLAVRGSGDVTRNVMGEMTERRATDVAAAGQVAYATAVVQSRYVMAYQRPRSEEQFRGNLMRAVSDPEFAAICEYARPVGREKVGNNWVEKIAKGPTIHLLRTALRLFGNNTSEPTVITETPEIRVVAITVSDYETNFHVVRTFTIEKRVEKREVQDYKTKVYGPPPGREILGERVNTEGDKVYICRMTLDELRKEELRQTALAKRAAAEEFLPRHIIRAALAKAVKVTQDKDAKDPAGAKNRLVDAFAEENVLAADLERYLGHSLERLSTDELATLRSVWTRISNDEATWEECLSERNPSGTTEDAEKIKTDKLAALRSGTTVTQAKEQAGNSGGESPSGEEKVATSTEQPAVATTGTVGAPAPESKWITREQVNQLSEAMAKKKLSDKQMDDIIRQAAKTDRIDHIAADLFGPIMQLINGMKGEKK